MPDHSDPIAMRHKPRIVRFAQDVLLQIKNDEALLLKLNCETVFALNASATRIATLLGEGLSIEAIVEGLSAEYGGDRTDEITADVQQLLTSLTDAGLVVESSD